MEEGGEKKKGGEAEKNPHPPPPPPPPPPLSKVSGEHRENIAGHLTHNSHLGEAEVPFGTYVTILRIGSEKSNKRRSRSVGDIRKDGICHDEGEGGGGGGRSRSHGGGVRGGVIRGETPIRIRVRSQVEDLTEWQKR